MEGDDGTDGQSEATPESAQSSMEQKEIAEQGGQRPGFLGIPIPETPPGVVCPDTTEDRSRGEQEDSDLEGFVEIVIEGSRGFVSGDDPGKCHMSDTEGKGESRIAERDGEHMGGEPEVIAQHRGEGMNRAIQDHGLAISEDQGGHGNRNGTQEKEPGAVDRLEDQGKENRAEGNPDHRFIHIGDGGATRDENT